MLTKESKVERKELAISVCPFCQKRCVWDSDGNKDICKHFSQDYGYTAEFEQEDEG